MRRERCPAELRVRIYESITETTRLITRLAGTRDFLLRVELSAKIRSRRTEEVELLEQAGFRRIASRIPTS